MGRVLFVGDSHGQALGPRLARAIPGLTSIAHPGWSEAKYAASADLAKLGGYDLVVVQLGGNNYETNAAKYEATVRRLLSAVGRARVLWVGPSTATDAATGKRHEATAEMQRALMPRLGVTWYDSRGVTRTGQRDDGVHFTGAGYDRWAQAIAGALRGASSGGAWGWWLAGAAVVAAVVVKAVRG